MTTSGSTSAPAAAAASASPFGAAGLDAAPGVDLVEGPTSASITSTPGGLDLDTLDGLEPTPVGASASPGTLPAEALAPGGGHGADSVDLLGLDLDDSPAPTGPSFVSGLSVTRLAAAIRALSPEDSANLRAAMAEADATPDEDTAAGGDPGTSSPAGFGTTAKASPKAAPVPPAPDFDWDALTIYLDELEPTAATKAPPPPFMEPALPGPPAPIYGSRANAGARSARAPGAGGRPSSAGAPSGAGGQEPGRQLPPDADYDTALATSIEREMAEQRALGPRGQGVGRWPSSVMTFRTPTASGRCGAPGTVGRSCPPTMQGVTLWFHYATCALARRRASGTSRAADAVQMLMRAFLLVLLGHFVDDFNGAEDNHTAESAHNAVAEFFAALGVWLSPTEECRKKILAQIDEASRSPHITAANSADTLSLGFRAALSALRRLVDQSRPRLVPWPGRVQGPFPVLYADAFFLDGDLRRKPGHLEPGDNVPKDARWRNGWGFVLLLGDHVFYDFGVIKPELLQPFVLPLVVFARRLGDDSVARREGWTRVPSPVDDVMRVLGHAAQDIDFACNAAPEKLLDLAMW
ncbi:PUB3 [Symbiodinium sp. CCMP2456]|nr:PUB3 [Symbiodinium sp. CCMP2456]